MIKVDVINLKKQVVGSVELPAEVFGQRVNAPLVLQVIKAQLAGLRQGTASNKTKSEVRGGGRKPFKQKGTGNARQGSSRSPLNPGGGSNFGPRPRKYNQDTPKKMVRNALLAVLSDKVASNHLLIVDKFDLKSHKTKDLDGVLKGAFEVSKAVVVDTDNANLTRAARNLPTVRCLSVDGLNVYDLVKHDWLILSKDSVQQIVKRFS